MKLYTILRPRDVIFTENETISELNGEKFSEEVKFLETLKYK